MPTREQLCERFLETNEAAASPGAEQVSGESGRTRASGRGGGLTEPRLIEGILGS